MLYRLPGAVSLVGLCIYALNPRESLEELWHPMWPYCFLQLHLGEHTASPSLDTLAAAELRAGHREAGVGPRQCEEFLPLHLQSVPLTLGFCVIMKKGCTQTQPVTGLRTTERLHRVVRYGSSTLVWILHFGSEHCKHLLPWTLRTCTQEGRGSTWPHQLTHRHQQETMFLTPTKGTVTCLMVGAGSTGSPMAIPEPCNGTTGCNKDHFEDGLHLGWPCHCWP